MKAHATGCSARLSPHRNLLSQRYCRYNKITKQLFVATEWVYDRIISRKHPRRTAPAARRQADRAVNLGRAPNAGRLTRPARADSKHTRSLCGRLRVSAAPIQLPVERRPDSVPLECFQNVQRCIDHDGGSIQYGWLRWEWPHVLIEAEFHATWRDLAGALHEVTGSMDDDGDVLFLPDDSRRYEGKHIDKCAATDSRRSPSP
jgi:hypothetical protein